MSRHRHKATRSTDTGWTHCVAAGNDHSERTHGNIVQRDECRCGATRATEINGGTVVSTGWRMPIAEDGDD